ncbi:MAG: hypothetical protein ACLVDB_04960 [Anaeromassilibacillus sp.]
MESILEEAKALAARDKGTDRHRAGYHPRATYKKWMLPELLHKLCSVDGVE